MEKEKRKYSEEEKHTAMGTIAGFVFQFYFFLYKLLTMEQGEIVSFEKLDDAATESEDVITFFQVKHTVQKAALEGKGKPLTNRAPDLWKAIDVWRKLIITEEKTVRTVEQQSTYINNHEFVLVSNKSCEDNKLLQLCDDIRNNIIKLEDVDKVLKEISEEARTKTKKSLEEEGQKRCNVQTMINGLKDYKLRLQFLKKIKFEYMSFDDIGQKCLNHISGPIRFPKEEAQAVFDDFMIEAVHDFKDCSVTGKALEYEYEQQLKRFEHVFKFHREENLDFRVELESFKQQFLDLVCIQQLIKVDDIKPDNLESVAKYASHFLSFKNRYLSLKDNYKLLQSEDDSFKQDAITFWDNEFTYIYDDINGITDEKDIIKKAKQLLREVRKKNLQMRKEILITPISNGAFYYLSDECLIGWHHQWKSFFQK